jgi:hypothetical protein
MEFICTESDKQDQLFDILYYSKETLDRQLSDCNNGIEHDNSLLYQSIKDGIIPHIYVATEIPSMVFYKITYGYPNDKTTYGYPIPKTTTN